MFNVGRMVEAWLPYGKTEIAVRVSDENLLGILEGEEREGVGDPHKLIYEAIETPLNDGPTLDSLITQNQSIAIVVDDKTRPAPTRLMLGTLIQKLRKLDVDTQQLHVIIGTGAHSMTSKEAQILLGEELFNAVHVHIHDSQTSDHVHIGRTSFGTEVSVNKVFMDADVRILTGDIGFHYFAGYGGGRKSVLPAIVGHETIQHNHSLLVDPRATTGRLDKNPVHEDMNEALDFVNIDFAINIVQNSSHQLVKAYAGDVYEIFQEGVKVIDSMYKVCVDTPADVVIVSPGGHPYDIDLYQAYKGIDSALNVVKQNGVIILIAECLEGYANQVFYEWMQKFRSFSRMRREITRNFVLGGHKAYYLMSALEKAKIILVSVMPDYYATGVFKLRTSKTANAALRSALRIVGRDRKIYIIPHGATTLPVIS
jgi:nickel-dependent lactate racemase